MPAPVLVALRVLLALLFAGFAAAAVFAPSFVLSVFGKPQGLALAIVLIAGAVCLELVLVSVWMLVTRAHDESIFDDRSHADRWVDLAIGALTAGAIVAAIGLVYFAAAEAANPSSATVAVLVVAAAATGASATLALVVAVMRRLLHRAMQLHSELAEVI